MEQLRLLDERVAVLDREIARRAKADAQAKRLMTIPGIGPITATALLPWRRRRRPSRGGATLRPGWGSRRCSAPRAEAETRRATTHGRANLAQTVDHRASAAVRWAMRKGSTADPWLTRSRHHLGGRREALLSADFMRSAARRSGSTLVETEIVEHDGVARLQSWVST